MQTGRKFVLVALCDAANDDGECFLCVETIAYKCGMGVRTVQGHLIDLESDKFIWREERLGRSSIYSINVVMIEDAEKNPLWLKRQAMKRTPAKVAGVAVTPAETAPPPAELAGAPAETAPIPVSYPLPTLKNNKKGGNGALPEKFTPNAACITLATDKGANAGEELAAFLDYHTANGSTFIDWQAAFRTWIRNSIKFGKQNKRIAAPRQSAPEKPVETFRERDARLGREKWELMTGRTHPESVQAPAHCGLVVDIATKQLES